jgi:hypothetical protein
LTLRGAKDINIPNGNWISLDNGNTWQHLNEITNNDSWDDTDICWFIRCITSHDSVASPILPTAFLTVPEKGNVGDTLQMELIHSTAATTTWLFDDASYSQTANDTAYVVWNTAGYHTVHANVTNPHGTIRVNESVPITDCNTPINTFPYELTFNQQNEFDILQRLCWEILHYGESNSYIIESGDISAIIGSGVDDRFVSPLFDLSDYQNIWLQLKHSTPEGFNITVEISQGGVDSSDFVSIYTLPTAASPTITPPINLSEHYQGNPIRIAVRMRNPSGRYNAFTLSSLRIWGSTEGIDDADNVILSVHPNPARQTLSVTLPDPDGTLTLFDATGRQLTQLHTSSTQTTVNVSTLPQGVYLLQFTSPRGTTTTRFVVQ